MFLGRFKKKIAYIGRHFKKQNASSDGSSAFFNASVFVVSFLEKQEKKLLQVVMLGKGFTLHILGLHV
jgi:hypothetical protein